MEHKQASNIVVACLFVVMPTDKSQRFGLPASALLDVLAPLYSLTDSLVSPKPASRIPTSSGKRGIAREREREREKKPVDSDVASAPVLRLLTALGDGNGEREQGGEGERRKRRR